ncbi:MAG: flavodoxin [Lachnospiraceae bacterium]|nr:flavodoxin [Lachnospiraceae bacterium]
MKDVYVVYWSSTGNTQAMAEAVGAGVTEAGGTAHVVEVSSADASVLKDAESFALGASAMGAEELDPDMDDFVTQVEAFAAGKTIGLFGSYDWGDGEWMRQWASRMQDAGATVAGGEDCIANLTPDEEAVAKCRALGAALVH